MDSRQKLFWEMMAQQKCGDLPRQPLPPCPYCQDDVTEHGDYGQFHCPACDGVWSPDEEPDRYTYQVKDGEWF
jgi:tRNA(Ile2) C34 agmatinyltransferase TiaS